MKRSNLSSRFPFATVFLFFVFAAFCVHSLNADEEKKIPRRVYPAPIPEEALRSLEPEQAAFARNLPYFLFSAITSIQYIVLVDGPEKSNSSISANVAESGGRVILTWTLRDKEAVRKTETLAYHSNNANLEEISKGIRAIAESFAPLLTEVVPEVSVERRTQEERQKRIVKEASFEDALSKPFQLTLWSGGFLQYVTVEPSTLSWISKTNSPYLTHFVMDLGWYSSPNFGLIASFYFDINDRMYFGSNDVPSASYKSGKEILSFSKTENTFTLGGIGFSYRTLGRLAGEFNMLLYMGVVTITAKDDIYYLYRSKERSNLDLALTLSEGEKASFFFTNLSIQPSLVLNLNERFSLKARISLNVDPRIIFNSNLSLYPYNLYSNFLFMYLGEIGAGWRF